MQIYAAGVLRDATDTELSDLHTYQAVSAPVLTKLYKSTFIRRLTASEATALETVLNEEEAYIRLLYQSVEWFDVADALVQYLHMTLEAAYGAERANTLLEPEA